MYKNTLSARPLRRASTARVHRSEQQAQTQETPPLRRHPIPEAMRSAAKSWARLQCLERVRRIRQYAGKEASESTSYTASNLPAHMPAHSIRAHWQVKRSALQPARKQPCWLGFAVPGRSSWDGRFQCNCPGACSTAPKLIAVRDYKPGTSSTFHSNFTPEGSPPPRASWACLRRGESVWVDGALNRPCAATGKRVGPKHQDRPAPLAVERTLRACMAEREWRLNAGDGGVKNQQNHRFVK